MEGRVATAVEIPHGAYWSTPFARWQGSFANLHALTFAANVTAKALTRRDIMPDVFDYGILGMTVPQHSSFYGMPWFMGLIGAERIGGPTVNQACATGVRILAGASQEIASGMATVALALSADRVSNGPHVYYPNPRGMGGTGSHEDWVVDNFNCDPYAGLAMIDTAENVARRYRISTEEQHEVVLRRYEQYADATADDHAFHKRYMDLPFNVPDPRFRKVECVLDGDEGIYPTTPQKLSELKPVKPDGTVTFAGQTHPADGSAAIIVATADRAADLSHDPKVRIRLKGFGQGREEKGFMPAAPIQAARKALANAGIDIAAVDCVKSHNPFVINDIAFAREFDIDVMAMNNFGCSLVWGHPQGPTGVRGVIELIEELVARGGGTGLFQGCAAGDSAMAVVIEVDSR